MSEITNGNTNASTIRAAKMIRGRKLRPLRQKKPIKSSHLLGNKHCNTLIFLRKSLMSFYNHYFTIMFYNYYNDVSLEMLIYRHVYLGILIPIHTYPSVWGCRRD